MNADSMNTSAPEAASTRKKFTLMTGSHRGRLAQIPIFLGKDFRMFIFQNDWKVLPMSALIAAIIALVVGANMFVTMEGQIELRGSRRRDVEVLATPLLARKHI